MNVESTNSIAPEVLETFGPAIKILLALGLLIFIWRSIFRRGISSGQKTRSFNLFDPHLPFPKGKKPGPGACPPTAWKRKWILGTRFLGMIGLAAVIYLTISLLFLQVLGGEFHKLSSGVVTAIIIAYFFKQGRLSGYVEKNTIQVMQGLSGKIRAFPAGFYLKFITEWPFREPEQLAKSVTDIVPDDGDDFLTTKDEAMLDYDFIIQLKPIPEWAENYSLQKIEATKNLIKARAIAVLAGWVRDHNANDVLSDIGKGANSELRKEFEQAIGGEDTIDQVEAESGLSSGKLILKTVRRDKESQEAAAAVNRAASLRKAMEVLNKDQTDPKKLVSLRETAMILSKDPQVILIKGGRPGMVIGVPAGGNKGGKGGKGGKIT
jgi:hypothetical protein